MPWKNVSCKISKSFKEVREYEADAPSLVKVSNESFLPRVVSGASQSCTESQTLWSAQAARGLIREAICFCSTSHSFRPGLKNTRTLRLVNNEGDACLLQ